MKYKKGFAPIVILIAILLAGAIGGVAYYAGKSSDNLPKDNGYEVSTLPFLDENTYIPPKPLSNSNDQTPPAPNPKQPDPKPLTACSAFPAPSNSKDMRQVSVTSDIVVAGWGILGTGGPEEVPGYLNSQSLWQYGVFECQNGTWNQLYLSAKGDAFITLSSLSNNSVLVVNEHSGAGTATFWEVVYNDGSKWTSKSGETVRNQALTQAGLEYMGYNAVSAVNGNIVEILPGYAKGDSRCCPTVQGKTATYSWNGSVLGLVSVQ